MSELVTIIEESTAGYCHDCGKEYMLAKKWTAI